MWIGFGHDRLVLKIFRTEANMPHFKKGRKAGNPPILSIFAHCFTGPGSITPTSFGRQAVSFK
jgi:hypothetical protein